MTHNPNELSRRRAVCIMLALGMIASSTAIAQPAQPVALHCIRTSAPPTQGEASWVKSFDVTIDVGGLTVDKRTVLNDGDRHEVIKNGEMISNDTFTRRGIVIIEPEVVRFGFEVSPKDGGASFRILSTIDRSTGDSIDNLSRFVCKSASNP